MVGLIWKKLSLMRFNYLLTLYAEVEPFVFSCIYCILNVLLLDSDIFFVSSHMLFKVYPLLSCFDENDGVILLDVDMFASSPVS